jgi:hypothetical protein
VTSSRNHPRSKVGHLVAGTGSYRGLPPRTARAWSCRHGRRRTDCVESTMFARAPHLLRARALGIETSTLRAPGPEPGACFLRHRPNEPCPHASIDAVFRLDAGEPSRAALQARRRTPDRFDVDRWAAYGKASQDGCLRAHGSTRSTRPLDRRSLGSCRIDGSCGKSTRPVSGAPRKASRGGVELTGLA